MRIFNIKFRVYRNEIQRDKEWFKLFSFKVFDWINFLLDSLKVFDWNNLEGNSFSFLYISDFSNSSMYFFIEEKSFYSFLDMKRKFLYLNFFDNLRIRSFYQLRNFREFLIVLSEFMQIFINWLDNIVFGLRLNFLFKENLSENFENERKSKLL